MNGPDHYTKAEDLLQRSQGEELEWAQLLVAQAQVHAALALAASNIDRDMIDRGRIMQWRVATQ